MFNFTIQCSPSNRVQVRISPKYSKIPVSRSAGKNIDFSLSQDNPPVHSSDYLGMYDVCAFPPPLSSPLSPPVSGSRGGLKDSLGISAQLHTSDLDSSSSVESCINNILPLPRLPRKKLFTRKARETLLDAAGALEKAGYAYDNFYFFTGTLPGSTLEACETFSRYSRYLLNALKNYLRKMFGLSLTFNTWEWQLRKKPNLTPALHLHLVVICENEVLGSKLPEILKNEWFRLLDSISRKSGIDLYSRADKLGGGSWTRDDLERLELKNTRKPLQVCKTIRCDKSPAAYLSKYVGKGSLSGDNDFQNRFKNGNLPLFYPSSWWSISDSIRDLIKGFSFQYSFTSPSLDKCWQAYNNFSSILESERLTQLVLNPFIPEWDTNKLYQNFYTNSDDYFLVQELASSYDGQTSQIFKNDFSSINKFDSLKMWFLQPNHYNYYIKLENSIPLYCRTSEGIYWDSPSVIKCAYDIFNHYVNYQSYQYDLLSLQDRLYEQKLHYIKHYGFDEYLEIFYYPLLATIEF